MSQQFESIEQNGKTFVRVPPNPSRMVRGMSRLAYNFEEAIADLVDNSIAAHATKVSIQLEQRIGNKVYIHVADNGDGIRKNDLPAAIQYGAADRMDHTSLGVYGFGLKTACQSFTDKFAVYSRVADDQDLHGIVFDESVINEHNDFLFESVLAPAKYVQELNDLAQSGSGTIVVTENADRFFVNSDNVETDKKAQKFVDKRISSTKKHLRKVFQRFLDVDDTRAVNVTITVNDEPLTPWDPFCLAEGLHPEAERIHPELKTRAGNTGTVILRGYILPSEVEFSDKELAKDADIGPSTHGVYVYRENRLIEMATYFGLFRRETHLTGLRVEFSYDGALDELFHTAIKKGSMSLGDLEEEVHEFLRPLVREANQRSRGRSNKVDTKGIHDTSQKRISAAEGRVHHASIEPLDEKNAMVKSKYGQVVLPIPSTHDEFDALPINPVESLLDGQLWQLRLHNGRQVVEISKNHDFYPKVYLPNRGNAVAVQGLDMIFWALAITEANCAIPEYQKQFREFRYEVSKILRELVETLPEVRLDEEDS